MRRYRPTKKQLSRKVGKVQEDGSFRTRGGGIFDPETGRIRAVMKPPRKTPAQTWASQGKGEV